MRVPAYSLRNAGARPTTDPLKQTAGADGRCRISEASHNVANTAKLLVVLLAFAWGFNWIAAAIALHEVTPWSLRFAGSGIGAITLFSAALLTGHSLRVPRGEHIHIMVAGFFNVAAFQILSAFAQLSGADLARDHHHLFDADLGDRARPHHSGRETGRHSSAGLRTVRGGLERFWSGRYSRMVSRRPYFCRSAAH